MSANSVYDGRGNHVGFRCQECGKVVPMMWGDTCNSCREVERRHQEVLAAIRERKPEGK